MSRFRRLQQHDFLNMSKHHLCIDCGFDTAPGCPSREQLREEAARQMLAGKIRWAILVKVDNRHEQYFVHDRVWEAAGMTSGGWDGCLCVGCLEARIGRELKPQDFSDHIFNTSLPATPRLLERQGRKQVRDVYWDLIEDCVSRPVWKGKNRFVLPELSPLDKALDLIARPVAL